MRPQASDLTWNRIYEPLSLSDVPIELKLESLARDPYVGLYSGSIPEPEAPDSLGRAPCYWADIDWGPDIE